MQSFEPAAQLIGARKSYGATVALDDISLTLGGGETLALLGPNGAGKTTAIRLLLGIAKPDTGSARIFGADPRERATRRRLGAMLQIGNIPATLTVREHIESFASYYPRPLPIDTVLELAGLTPIAKRLFGNLSGGQRQRVFFAIAICGDPDLLVLDEPTVGLDIESREVMWGHIRAFVALGKSVLLTTHYLGEAEALADRIALITAGRIIAEGTAAELQERSATSGLEAAYLALTRQSKELVAVS